MNYESDDDDYSDFAVSAEPAAKRLSDGPFPVAGVDLLRPPGFVGEIADWIDAQCLFPRRRLAVASALVTVGNIGGLRHIDPHSGVTGNILAFCVAASATGKEAIQQAMAQLHIAVGVQNAVQGGIKSEQEIVRNMIEHQPAYYIVDEIGIFLTKIRNAQNRGGAAYLEGVFGTIMSAYSKANSRYLLNGDTKRELRKGFMAQLARAQDAGDDKAIADSERMVAMVDQGLDRPFLSLIGYTTPSTFDGVMDGETATQGFVGRAIIVNEPDINPRARVGFQKAPLGDAMVAALNTLRHGGSYDQTPHRRIEHDGPMTEVQTTDDAAAMLQSAANWLHDYAEDMGEHTGEASVAMARRSYEMIAKLSFVLGMGSGVRGPDDVRWAFAYVRAELDAKIALVFANDNKKERPEEALAARLINYIDAEKGVTISVLANRMKIKPEALLPVLSKMQDRGMVAERMSGRRYKGADVTVWVRTA